MLACAALLAACGGSSGGSGGSGGSGAPGGSGDGGGESTTSGPAYSVPGSVALVTFNEGAAQTGNDCAIDTSQLSQGVVGASARSDARLKFQVVKGEMSYNYDLPGDGTPIIVPINMGDGPYTFRVMQNTSGNNYVELFSVIENVNLSSETAPYLVPNMFVNYNESSAVVAKARELAQGARQPGGRGAQHLPVGGGQHHLRSRQGRPVGLGHGLCARPGRHLGRGHGYLFRLRIFGRGHAAQLGHSVPSDYRLRFS